MIIFDLTCANGHCFEGWFEDTQAFEKQCRENLLTCPVCDDTHVSKVLSPVAIKSSPENRETPPSSSREMKQMVRKISEFVDRHFDDVGCNFAAEALKMHYGVIEPRNIRGVSTEQEEKTLKEEGVEFFKIPALPSNKTDA